MPELVCGCLEVSERRELEVNLVVFMRQGFLGLKGFSAWMAGGRGFLKGTGGAIVVGLLLCGPSVAGAAAAGPSFSHEVVVDHQRSDGEPSLSISPKVNGLGYHDMYVSAPYGFSTTASFVWKSEDGGQTFHLVGAEVPPAGRPASTCAGGGDSSIVNDTAGDLYFGDLQGLTNVSNSLSTDGGDSFVTTCNSANGTGDDRPWLSVYRDPLTNGREYMTVDQVEQCTINCGLGQAGSNMLELTQTSGALAAKQVFEPLPAQQVEPDGIVGGTVVNQSNGDLYLVHTGFTNAKGGLVGGGDANGNANAVIVDRFPHGYDQTTPTPIPTSSVSLCKPYNTSASAPCKSDTVFHAPLDKSGNSTVTVGQDFSPVAIDRSGDLYVVWAQARVNSSGDIDGPSTIYLAVSTNKGATWSKPIDVSSHVSGLRTNVFPWVAAGSKGRVDIVWYGTHTLGNCAGTNGCGSSFIDAPWNVYMAQTIDAVNAKTGNANASPSFMTTKVTEYSNHYGAICTFGIGCSTGGDRGLLDFIQVQAEPDGAAAVVWADSANTDFNGGESSGVIAFAQQVGGPGLYGGTIKGPKPLTGSAPGSPSSYFAGDGTETKAPAHSNMDIVRSSLTSANNGKDYKVTMRVGSLASLAPDTSLGGTDLIWMTRWELPTAHPTTADQGHVFYAAMESDDGGTPTFYAGESVCGIPPNNPEEHCKFLNYPATDTLTKGSYTKAGTITILVPVADVGGATKGRLYSVTGLTGTQSEPSSTGKAIFNLIDSTPPYDVTLK